MPILYTQPGCQPCKFTAKKAESLGLVLESVDIQQDEFGLAEVKRLGYKGTPVVYVDENTHWQGYSPDKLTALALA